MCGIVGVTGQQNASSILIEGLRRLEYRGYDSAGIAVRGDDGALHRVRAPGKLSALEAKLTGSETGGTGIGHTRWATHGAPNETNAHPHRAGQVTLAHNGIIENFKPLREEMVAAGRTFVSETDTEVVAHLLDEALKTTGDVKQALASVLSRLEGAFALVAILDDHPGVLLGARRGAPLIAAKGDEGAYLASDIMALSGHAHAVIYLEDGDAVILSAEKTEIFDSDGQNISRSLRPAPTSIALAEKGNHRHFMQKEIYEQPEVVGRTLTAYIDTVGERVKRRTDIDFATITRLHIIGCGTAAYAGQVAEYWFERMAGLPVKVDIASEFRYREPAFMPGDAALFISQSGETADTLEALRLCKQKGLKTIALVNTPHSTMAREADTVAPTLAGPEIGVASTKAFTCQLAALASLALMAGVQRGAIDAAAEKEAVSGLMAIPALMNAALQSEGQVNALAHELSHASIVLYLGRNEFFPLALEGALKLKEISYIHAEGYAAGELKHGPIALIEDDVAVIVIAPFDGLFQKTRSSILEVKSRGARVIAITDPEGKNALGDEASAIVELPAAPPQAAAIVSAVAVQLLAYYVAVHKGTDVDQPRNLAKSVTVE